MQDLAATVARWSSIVNWKHVQIGPFYKPAANASPAVTASGVFTEEVKNKARKEAVNISRWVATEEIAPPVAKQSSKEESLTEPTKQPELLPEINEAFGSSRLLDLLYSI